MASSFENLRARIEQDRADAQPSATALEAMEFLADPWSSLDDVPEATLEAWIEEVGGVDRFCNLRAEAQALARENAVELLVEAMRVPTETNNPEARFLGETLTPLACDALGFPAANLAPHQRLFVYECIAEAYESFLQAIATEAGRTPPDSAPDAKPQGDTAWFELDRTTVQLAFNNPELVLRRGQRLAALHELNPSQARIYRLAEHAGREPEEISELLKMEDPSSPWTVELVEQEYDAARAFCFG